MSPRFENAIARFDEINATDPNTDFVGDASVPHELRYARCMSEWLNKMYPDASEALRLAVRCQHIARWTMPRKSYPMNRIGYLKWRVDLQKFHAATAAAILREVGYEEPTIARVGEIVRKEHVKSDPDSQALEDVACLVFLETEYSTFSAKHEDAKVIDILRRTWKKMSPTGHAAAISLPMHGRAKTLVENALAGS